MKKYTTYTVEEASRKLERYCAYQERCHKEVRLKLTEMRMIPKAIDTIIAHLIQHDFLNESRFVVAFTRGKFNQKKWGKNRIIRELKAREISQYNLKLALKEIDDTEYEKTFGQLAQKRLDQLKSEKNLQRKRRKLADYLLYRGWESARVWEKVKELV